VALSLRGDDAQHVQAVGVAGVNGQTLPAQPFRFGQTSALVLADGFGEYPRRCH
jgi:hypothetical protein